MDTSIFVVGMPRSGTSLITDVIRRWGAQVGPEQDVLPADQFNPQGYWEYLPLKRFNDMLLASLGANERFPPDPSDQCLLQTRAADPVWQAEARAVLAPLNRAGNLWVVKDPRLRMLLPFWTHILPDLACVVMLRQPLDLALSLQRLVKTHVPAARYPLSAILLEWQNAMLAILQATAQRPATLFVEYERLVAEPQAVCGQVDRWLASYCQVAPGDPRRLATMIDAVTPALQHQRGGDATQSHLLTPEQCALYAALQAKAQGSASAIDPTAFPLYPGWREYLQVVDTLFQLTVYGSEQQSAQNWHDIIAESISAS